MTRATKSGSKAPLSSLTDSVSPSAMTTRSSMPVLLKRISSSGASRNHSAAESNQSGNGEIARQFADGHERNKEYQRRTGQSG